MTQKDAYAEGREHGEQAAIYCEVGAEDRREAGCEHEDGECAECLMGAAFESEQNARQFSPWEFFAHDVNEAGGRADGLWEAYDRGVAAGIKRGVRDRLRVAA